MPEKIGKISFAALDGNPPSDLALNRLPEAARVASIVESAFVPYSNSGVRAEILAGLSFPFAPPYGFHLIYAYGHAWMANGEPNVSSRTECESSTEAGSQLVGRLLKNADLLNTILVLDCCHAAAFDLFMEEHKPRLVVYASGADEKAIALHGDKASRLSLAFETALRGKSRSKVVDLVAVIASIAEQLDKDSVLRGQSVSYRVHGSSLRLIRGDSIPTNRRERTVVAIRNALIGVGAATALGAVWAGWYYWSHSVVELDLTSLGKLSRKVILIASVERPGINGRDVFAERVIGGNNTRVWVPADNILLRIDSDFRDGQERALSFHMILKPGFWPSAKLIKLSLPAAEEIERHPGMAHIPATAWFHGRERTSRTSERPFWIDIRPPMVAEYLPLARHFSDQGLLEPEGSLLIDWRTRSSAVDAVGLGQLRELSNDLGEIFGIIDAANSERVSAPGEIVAGLGQMPCDRCPAPMTRAEAILYCEHQGKRLPTNFEWELAVRGVDGRTYPWGNQFDEYRANVPGLPEKGEDSPSLKPVSAYDGERSPFGLVDTVGNAGDWVENSISGYERSYMGATYRYNPEDATAFRLLPVTEADSLMREITVRCVAAESET